MLHLCIGELMNIRNALCAVVGIFLLMLAGCSAGGPNSSLSASVTNGSCTNMKTGSTCTITLNVFNNNSGALLSYSPTLFGTGYDQNQSFSNSVAQCNTTVAAVASQTANNCFITIIYQSTGTVNNENLTFYLCNPGQICQASTSISTSNSIALSGN